MLRFLGEHNSLARKHKWEQRFLGERNTFARQHKWEQSFSGLPQENAKALKYHLFILYHVYFDCPHSALFSEYIAYFEGINYSSHKALQMIHLMQTMYIFK